MNLSASGDYKRWKFNGMEAQVAGDVGLLDYGARMYDTNLGRWMSPDPLAEAAFDTSPYAYCRNNPMNRIDPTGAADDWYLTGIEAEAALQEVKKSTEGIVVSRNADNGKMSYTGSPTNEADRTYAQLIDDHSINLHTNATDGDRTSYGNFFFGGGFGGAEYNKKTKSVYVYQDVNPAILAEINNYYGSDKGENILHEASEGYEAGKLAQEVRGDIIRNTIGYDISHGRAMPQFKEVLLDLYDKTGTLITNKNEAVKAEWYVVSPDKEKKILHTIED